MVKRPTTPLAAFFCFFVRTVLALRSVFCLGFCLLVRTQQGGTNRFLRLYRPYNGDGREALMPAAAT